MVKTCSSGFTLVEMMVVLVVSLLLMTMTFSIFHVSTRTVQRVERRLAVYEAARNTIDRYECEIQAAFINEKGEEFCIKACNYMDTDPFTPAAVPAGSDKKFYQSRREMDAIYYARRSPGQRWTISPYSGGVWQPFAEPDVATTPDLYRAYIRPNLLYGYLQPPNTVNGFRDAMLADVSQITADIHLEDRTGTYNQDTSGMTEFLPGGERNAPNDPVTFWDWGKTNNGANVMDLDIAYWDDTVHKFLNLPDFTAVYFAPPPMAIRITVTVCDSDKRDQVTLSRVIKIPVGNGPAAVLDTRDADFCNPSYPFNRTKDLKKLEPNI
jgi:prepilin-type N-terminal cleavage/methylation domain-containing protein